MPYYVWIDKNTEKEVAVQRKIKDIETPPDKDECLDNEMDIEEYANADWQRGLSPTPNVGEKNKGFW